jgi:hypothetical protein
LRVLAQRTLECSVVTVGLVAGFDATEPHFDAAL